MKTIKKILFLMLSVGIALSILNTTFAAESKLKQVFTPARPGIEFNGEGFSYPSFNNFTENPNIGNSFFETLTPPYVQTKGDERVFMNVEHVCRDGGATCCTDGSTAAICKFYDTIGMVNTNISGSKNLKVGDIVRFQIYFHNNGSDQYDDNDQKNSPNAKNVKIGIDLSNISKLSNDPEPNIIRPKGFIYADNNTYKINGKTTTGVTATDDVQAFYEPQLENVSLEIIANSAFLEMNTKGTHDDGIEFAQYITSQTPVTFETDKGNKTYTATPVFEGNKAWLQFNELPGCFRYSGLAYFDAEVVAEEKPEEQPENPNFCTSLSLTKIPACSFNQKMTYFSTKVNFNQTPIPTGGYVTFYSDDLKSKIYINPDVEKEYTLPHTHLISNGQLTGYYKGLGSLQARFTDAKGDTAVYVDETGNKIPIDQIEAYSKLAPSFCESKIPTCTDDCVDICVQHPVGIPVGSLSEFSAEATGYYGDTWSGDIKYYAEKGKGKFYTGTKEQVIAQIKKDFPGANPYENPNIMLGCDNLINIVITPQNILNLIQNTFETKDSIDLETQQEIQEEDNTFSLPQYNFLIPTEQLYELPENYEMEKLPTKGDPSPIDTKKFMNSVLMALDLKTVQPKAQDIDLKPKYDISTGTGEGLKTIDQGDMGGALDLNNLDINVPQDYVTPEIADLPKGNFNFTPISSNDEPLNPINYESAVTAKDKEKVWFYAAEEGGDSIVVSATGTLNPDCSQRFDTSPPSLCQSMKVSAHDKKSAGNLPCINEGQTVEFQIDEVATTNGKKLDLIKDKVSTLWTTTDPIGKFENAQKTFPTTKTSITYTGKGQVQCEVTSINGVTDANSLCTYGIATCPKVIEKCGKLDLKFNEIVDPVASNKITTVDKTIEAKGAEMTLAVASDKNADYPSYVAWEDKTEGELTFKNPQYVQKLADTFMTKTVKGVETTITIKNYSAKYPEAGMPTLKNAKHEGTVTAKVQGEESICTATLSVIEVVEAKVTNVCRALTYQVQRMGDPASIWASNQSTLSNTENYLIKNTVTYSPDIDESLKFVDYKTNKGYFSKAVKIGEKPGATELQPWLINALSGIMLPAGDIGWVQELKGVPAGKQVIFMPDKTLAPGPYPQAVEITASNSNQLTEPGCTKYIRLVVPESARACKSITLNATPWPPASEQNKIKLYLTLGDLGNYVGNFSFSVYGSAKPYLSSDSIPDQNKLKSLDVSKDQAFETGVYLLDPDMSASWTVEVKASGEVGTICTNSITYAPPTIPPVIPPGGQTACSSLDITKPKSWVIDEDDDQEFEVSVQPTNYPWTIEWDVTGGGNAYFDKGKTTVGGYTNELKNISGKPKVKVYVEGQTQCHDEIEASIVSENETPPSMKKKVAKGKMDDIDGDDWEDIINVSGKTLGESQPDQFITYKIEYKNGHNKGIKSVLIEDKEMEDEKITSKGKLGGTLEFDDMKIKVDKDDDFDRICKYKEVLKKNIKLDPANTKPCVTTEEQANTDDEDLDIGWDNIVDSFTNKDSKNKGLVFNNLEDDTKITIFYQMENKTALNDDTCKKLLAEDGCGEEFVNTASFEAYKGDNAQGSSEYDDTDSTKVIAVCPYILTRASGDVFFESTLETGAGIDVAYCSKQKNIQAPIITPIKVLPGTPSTGGGEVRTLTLPSHDICKYSNVTQEQSKAADKEANPSDYQNPFANFSSTICEMKAEVAEDWVKANVVDQISMNAEKVSLWAPAQRNSTINSMQDLAASANGILRWNDTLTIGSHDTYTINKSSTLSVPAAQTYIIMNADLNINSNIIYGSNALILTDLKSYPSAAFIVINGNINIAPDVTQLDGTYIAIDTDPTDGISNTGKVNSTNSEVSYSQLTINGSLIGDVTDLFTNRRYVGNVAADEGSVTIKYNENFLLNPPPGLNQLMDIKQLEVAY